MPAPFQNRGEEMFRRSEFYIDDNLDSVIRKKDRYSLYFKGEDNNFERHAYYRISGKLLKAGELTVTLPVVKKQDLAVSGNGDFGVGIELFYRKPGRAADDIYDKPDSVLYMPVPEGTGKYQAVSETFALPEDVAWCLPACRRDAFQRRMLGGSSAPDTEQESGLLHTIHQVCPKTGQLQLLDRL